METWAIVTLVLGTSALSSLLTFFITKMQVSHSDARLAKQLARQREVDNRQRRWEVRGEPLLKLRAELARMAAINENIANWYLTIQQGHDARDLFEKAVKDYFDYAMSGDFLYALYVLEDAEIVERARKVVGKYSQAVMATGPLGKRDISPQEIQKSIDTLREIETEVINIQKLINNRLEEL